jgi:hypothetical protein
MNLPFSKQQHITVTCRSDYTLGFGFVSRFIGYSPVVITINCNTLKITVVGTAHTESRASQSEYRNSPSLGKTYNTIITAMHRLKIVFPGK